MRVQNSLLYKGFLNFDDSILYDNPFILIKNVLPISLTKPSVSIKPRFTVFGLPRMCIPSLCCLIILVNVTFALHCTFLLITTTMNWSILTDDILNVITNNSNTVHNKSGNVVVKLKFVTNNFLIKKSLT